MKGLKMKGLEIKQNLKMKQENNSKKETKKQVVVDEKLKAIEKRERQNYRSKSWRIISGDGFYNW